MILESKTDDVIWTGLEDRIIWSLCQNHPSQVSTQVVQAMYSKIPSVPSWQETTVTPKTLEHIQHRYQSLCQMSIEQRAMCVDQIKIQEESEVVRQVLTQVLQEAETIRSNAANSGTGAAGDPTLTGNSSGVVNSSLDTIHDANALTNDEMEMDLSTLF